MHEDRVRAEVFGADAEAYDRARPTYPPALIDDLMAGAPTDVLDVGCGTGKVGRLLADRGCRVLGLEPDPRMAEVARRHGLDVEVGRFEEWDDAGRRFDLLVSGQAWHWVDPVIGGQRAAAVLRPGGRWAVFWNLGQHDPPMQVALDAAYEAEAPELVGRSVALGCVALNQPVDGIDPTGAFGPQDIQVYEWQQSHSRDEWLDQLPTHSDHRLLPDAQRARLLAAVGAAIDVLGGTLVLRYQTVFITAVRTQH